MINQGSIDLAQRALSKRIFLVVTAGLLALGAETSTGEATEPPYVSSPPINGGGGFNEASQFQEQNQAQFQEQFQEQGQAQRQGDNRVSVDGDNVDYFALALPNLVAANCAGSSFAVGGGGGGIGFGFGKATVDQNCQIAKAIATAHLLEGAKLVKLTSSEYREALCQMRGMEHVCKAPYKKRHHAKWCKYRVKRDAKASKWSDRDLGKCGLRRAYFKEDRDRWLKLTHYDGREVEQHKGRKKHHHGYKKKTRYHDCRKNWNSDACWKTPAPPKDKVRVRVGQHCDYDRVVFDWPKPVSKPEVQHYGDKITISFDQAGPIDVSRVQSGLGRFILDAEAADYGTKSSTTFTLASGVKPHVWTSENRVVVDGKKRGC